MTAAVIQWASNACATAKRFPPFAMQLTRNGFAVLGVAVACSVIAIVARPDLREQSEAQLGLWLQTRQPADISEVVPTSADIDGPSERALASDPKALPKDQARVAHWLSKKYRVAPEPLSVLVGEAYEVGRKTKLDPTLILAVMAIESRFNPFAQSAVGAQGLMQVMTRIHIDKYESFGGELAAFDPVANLRVGVQILQDCIRRAGSLEGGLRYYVGAANLPDDGGYAAKVLAEHFRILQVATGRSAKAQPQAPAGTLSTKAAPADAADLPVTPQKPIATATDKVALL